MGNVGSKSEQKWCVFFLVSLTSVFIAFCLAILNEAKHTRNLYWPCIYAVLGVSSCVYALLFNCLASKYCTKYAPLPISVSTRLYAGVGACSTYSIFARTFFSFVDCTLFFKRETGSSSPSNKTSTTLKSKSRYRHRYI